MQCMLHPHISREGASNDVKVLRTNFPTFNQFVDVAFNIALHGFHNGGEAPHHLCYKAEVVNDSQCVAEEAQNAFTC